jgi:hypothetical protein
MNWKAMSQEDWTNAAQLEEQFPVSAGGSASDRVSSTRVSTAVRITRATALFRARKANRNLPKRDVYRYARRIELDQTVNS